MYSMIEKKKPAASKKPVPFATPELAAVARALMARPNGVAPPACSLAVVRLLRKVGPTGEEPMRVALRIAGKSLYYNWTRKRIDATLSLLGRAGAVVRGGDAYALSPVLLAARRRPTAAAGPGDYREFVALGGCRHFYSKRCADDMRAMYDLLGDDNRRTTTPMLLAFEVLGIDWSGEAVENTLAAMNLESGPAYHREGWSKFDCPFAMLETVEGFIADRRREYAAA